MTLRTVKIAARLYHADVPGVPAVARIRKLDGDREWMVDIHCVTSGRLLDRRGGCLTLKDAKEAAARDLPRLA